MILEQIKISKNYQTNHNSLNRSEFTFIKEKDSGRKLWIHGF